MANVCVNALQRATLQMTTCYRLKSLGVNLWFAKMRNCESVESCGESKRENKISDNHLSFPYDTRKHLDYAYSYCIQAKWWPHVQPTQQQLKSCSKQNAELCRGKKFLPASVWHQVTGGVRQWDMGGCMLSTVQWSDALVTLIGVWGRPARDGGQKNTKRREYK